jgi:glyoxylase-like metal-dependent hydrolase (beta-lactamase superfamily II)
MTIERLADGVFRVDAVPIRYAISVLLINDAQGWTLVDTGVSITPRVVKHALRSLGATAVDLKTIYLTHHHSDHVGGLHQIREWNAAADVAAFTYEAEILRGERNKDELSNPLLNLLMKPTKVRIVPQTRSLDEAATVGGFRVVATPGHTGGHTSLLSDKHGILFTADAFGRVPDKLGVGVRPGFCTDPTQAMRSAEKLLEEDYETVVFSHGPVIRSDAKKRLEQIIAHSRR